jgi:hypothetical protein
MYLKVFITHVSPVFKFLYYFNDNKILYDILLSRSILKLIMVVLIFILRSATMCTFLNILVCINNLENDKQSIYKPHCLCIAYKRNSLYSQAKR